MSDSINFTKAELEAIAEMEAEERGDAPAPAAEPAAAPVAEAAPTPPAPTPVAETPVAAPAEAPAAPAADAPTASPLDDDDEPALYKVQDIKALNDSLEAAKLELASIEAKAEAGEINQLEAMRASNKITLKMGELSSDIKTAQSLTEQNEQNAAAHSGRTMDRFLKHPDNVGLYKPGSVAWVAMDAKLRTLAKDEANSGKNFTWFLREADRLTREDLKALGVTFGKPAAAPSVTPAAPAAPAIDRKQTVPVPTTLSTMPAAAHETMEGEFAVIDNLSGIAREQAIARLTPEQYARYLSFA